MADLAWSAWYDEVLPGLPKCPRARASNAIRDSAIRFCKETRAYYLESDAINIVANTKEYAWTKTGVTNVEAFEIWQALYNTSPLEPATRQNLVNLYSNWSVEKGTPGYFLRARPSVVRLVPYPTESITGGLILHAFVNPKRSASGIVDEIAERYYQEIALGAKARLMLTTNVPYSNPQLGVELERQFNEAISNASLSAEGGDTEAVNEGEGSFY